MLEVALERVEKQWLFRWWRDKYRRPGKDPLLLEYTMEELYVEWLEDQGAEEIRRRLEVKDEPPPAKEMDVVTAIEESGDPFDGLPEGVAADMQRFFQKSALPAKAELEEFFDNYEEGDGR